jgi:hypothetical protein
LRFMCNSLVTLAFSQPESQSLISLTIPAI